MVYAKNKKASFDYFLLEKYETGIELIGTEVKSIRLAKLSVKEAFVRIIKDELFILNMHISPYEFGNINNVEETTRPRRLLMSKKEILKLKEKTKEKGLTLVPISVYAKGRYIKVEIALAKGKKNYDKRQSLKEKDINRRIDEYR
ncbi:MAG: SsrA-binding protein SmpB [Oceanivirga sp.]|nr:SsrA-binding protein SmpB [Oceanivirga sp.]